MVRDGILANTPIYYGLGVSLLTFVGVSLTSRAAPALRSATE
jgi:SSS family solute:Na+ symporter